MQDPKKSPKIAIWAPSHNFVKLYLRNQGTYRQLEKKLVKRQYVLQMSPQYGERRPTNGWEWLAGLGHPIIFQRVSHLGSVTARQSSSGCQPNFAALNRGRHLCLAGRPSRWALAHILFCLYFGLGLLFIGFTGLVHAIMLFALVVLGAVFSILSQGIIWEECLRSDLFCVKWDVKT